MVSQSIVSFFATSHTVGTAMTTKCSAATMSAGLTRMLNMSLVIGRSVIAVTPGWKVAGNRHWKTDQAATPLKLTS